MKRIVFFVLVAAGLLGAVAVLGIDEPTAGPPLGLPPVPIPEDNPQTPEKIALGEKLYNEEKFQAAIAAGNVQQAMSGDLDEGRGLFVERIDERVREERDYLGDELLRVARARGMS